MSVSHRDTDVRMAEVFLDLQDVCSLLNQMTGEGVAEDVPADRTQASTLAMELIYIGEWHSHPAGGSTASIRDLTSMAQYTTEKELQDANLSMIIIGLGGTDPSFGASCYTSKKPSKNLQIRIEG